MKLHLNGNGQTVFTALSNIYTIFEISASTSGPTLNRITEKSSEGGCSKENQPYLSAIQKYSYGVSSESTRGSTKVICEPGAKRAKYRDETIEH